MKRTKILISALAVIATALHTRADVLELKNGQVVAGQYIGGTAGTIRFQTAAGMQVIQTSQALALTFTGGSAPAAPSPAAPPPAAAPAPSAASGIVTVNAGTGLLVRMLDG